MFSGDPRWNHTHGSTLVQAAAPAIVPCALCVCLQFGVTSRYGPFISSGLIATSHKHQHGGQSWGSNASALSARVLRNPQDNSADLILRVAVAPSYVTYSPAAVQDVTAFFKSDEVLELSRLQAQAAARTDKLKHMAQLQLQALSQRSTQQKPRMQLLMTLHAPKVAIPGKLSTFKQRATSWWYYESHKKD